MRKRKHRSSSPLVILLPLPMLLLGACDLGGLGGFGGFDSVDEDFERPSPLVATQGALQSSCEPPQQPQQPLGLARQDQVFVRALCLCGDLEQVGNGLFTNSSSTMLGSDPGLAAVGINGEVEVVGNFEIDGALEVAEGLQGVGNVSIEGDLITGDGVQITGSWAVGRDAWIDGDLQGVGSLSVARDLYLTGDLSAVGSVSYDEGHRGFAYGGPPCACGAERLVDVAAEVEARRDDNDNSLLSWDSSALVLPTGEYYFDQASELIGSASILVTGRAAVFVDDDLEAVGNLNVTIQPGAELELWVLGHVASVGNLSVVSQSDLVPRSFRLYMGGEGNALMNVGNAVFVGSIYAPLVDIEYVGNLEVQGSLFANNISGTGNLTISYDTDVVTTDDCVDQALLSPE